ncbi:MAG: hypothetical protein KA914_02090 [Ottowia sp.]|nr:hypothetical protein [Ottowia sp.]
MKNLTSPPARLWRAREAFAGLVLAWGSMATNGVGAAMNDIESTELIKRTVLQGSGWEAEDLEIEADPLLKSNASCRLLVGGNTRIPGAGLIRLALDPDGRVMARTGDMTGLTRVLHECVQADAFTWAQTLAVYVNAMAPKVINSGDLSLLGTLKAAGAEDVLPTLKQVDGGTELRFVMWLPVSRYFRVTALVPAGGPTRVDMQIIETR